MKGYESCTAADGVCGRIYGPSQHELREALTTSMSILAQSPADWSAAWEGEYTPTGNAADDPGELRGPQAPAARPHRSRGRGRRWGRAPGAASSDRNFEEQGGFCKNRYVRRMCW